MLPQDAKARAAKKRRNAGWSRRIGPTDLNVCAIDARGRRLVAVGSWVSAMANRPTQVMPNASRNTEA